MKWATLRRVHQSRAIQRQNPLLKNLLDLASTEEQNEPRWQAAKREWKPQAWKRRERSCGLSPAPNVGCPQAVIPTLILKFHCNVVEAVHFIKDARKKFIIQSPRVSPCMPIIPTLKLMNEVELPQQQYTKFYSCAKTRITLSMKNFSSLYFHP